MSEEEKKAIEDLEKFIGIFYEFPNPTSVSIRDYEVTNIETILNLIQKQQSKIEKLKNQNKLASKEHEERFNEFEAKIAKKDKIIDELAARVYLTEEEREEMKKDIQNSYNAIPFSKWVKQYFEKKVE